MVYVRFVLTTLFVGLFSVTVSADDMTPAEEAVCDELALPGATPGLFGLCNAYCEAQDCDEELPGEESMSCSRLLTDYENTQDPANPLDVDMPCLAVEEATCPCWTEDELAEGGMLLPPLLAFCEVDGPAPPAAGDAHYDGAVYLSFSTFEAIFYENFEDSCQYTYVDENGVESGSGQLPTTPAENQLCQDDVHALFLADFGGTVDNPHAGCSQLP